MGDKLKQLEIKKLIQEYNFLLLDDEYKKEIISENRVEFLEKVLKLKTELGIQPQEEPKEPENQETPPPNNKNKIDPNSVNKSTKDKVKKLYREIAKKTHPDRTTSEELVDLYMRATIASEEYNLFELFIICVELHIEMDLDMEDRETLMVLIEMKKNELKSIETSFIWLYVNSKTEEEKNKLIELFVKKHG